MARIVIVLFCLVPILSVSSGAQQPPEFREAYSAYTELVNQGKAREAIPHAEKALDIALRSDGFDDETRGMLAFNLGFVYLADDQYTASADTFTQALELFGKAGGASDLRAEAYLYRGICYRNLYKHDEAISDFENALKLLTGKDPKIRVIRADILENLAWSEVAADRDNDAYEHAVEAHKIFSELFSDRHPQTINSLLALSAAHFVRGSKVKARNLLAQAVDLADKAGYRKDEADADAQPGKFSLSQFIRFHRNVALLYKLMDRERDARYHEDLAKDLRKGIPPPAMRVTPAERRAPRYPRRALRRGTMGWVIVEFTVRKDGTTSDIRIVDSAPEDVFDRVATEAVKEWTYEPPTEDGKPSAIENVRTTIAFVLEL